MMDIVINLTGLALIALIVWWFWLWKPQQGTRIAQGAIDIVVADGVYQPAQIELRTGETSTLRFIRKDPSPCAATVIIDGLDISEELPIEKAKEVQIAATEIGTFPFHCQMNMYKGVIKVIS